MPIDRKMVETEARLFATPLSQKIGAEANKKMPKERAAFACVAASLVLQTILISLAVTLFEIGGKDGEDWLKTSYDNALKDALERWHKPDLKERRQSGYL